ncbi:hypothetical protein EKD04_009830 [Chloroflexales bacterium ZM16-3]|nr:hypothetical protein [Chloroflexales bacterium ZM16-3]
MDWTFALTTVVNNGNAIAQIGPVPYMFTSYLPVFVAGLLTIKVARSARKDRPEDRPVWDLLFFAVLTPCLVATIISLAVRPILLDRSLIGVSGPLFVLLAWVAVRSWQSL